MLTAPVQRQWLLQTRQLPRVLPPAARSRGLCAGFLRISLASEETPRRDGYGDDFRIRHAFHETPVHEWTSLVLLDLVTCDTQGMFLGLLGDELGQVLMKTMARPLHLVREPRIPPLPVAPEFREQGNAN